MTQHTAAEMRVLVCGGRDFAAVGYLTRQLSLFHAHTPIGLLIEGGADGADRLAREWAKSAGIPVKTFPADWAKHGRAAGPIRNQQMLDDGKPHWVIAFPGGRGTEDMVKRAEAAGIDILRL